MQKLSYLTSAIADKNDGQILNAALKGVYDRLSCMLLSTGGLAIKAGGGVLIKAGTLCKVLVKGTLVSIAANTDSSALVGTVTNAKFNVYCVFCDVAGTLTTVMGVEGATLGAVKFPPIPEGKAMMGFVIINPTGTGNFVGGTTPLDDATVVPNAVYVNTVGSIDPTALI
jgi:hypothetical protein